MKEIYLDNASTTKIDDEVLKSMIPYLKEEYGNASAIYSLGRRSRKKIEESRETIARILNCNSDEIYLN